MQSVKYLLILSPNFVILPQSLWNLASLTWYTKTQMAQREWNMQCPEMLE